MRFFSVTCQEIHVVVNLGRRMCRRCRNPCVFITDHVISCCARRSLLYSYRDKRAGQNHSCIGVALLFTDSAQVCPAWRRRSGFPSEPPGTGVTDCASRCLIGRMLSRVPASAGLSVDFCLEIGQCDIPDKESLLEALALGALASAASGQNS
jgi:hypothetical protein